MRVNRDALIKAAAAGVVISLIFSAVGIAVTPTTFFNLDQIAPTTVWLSLTFTLLALIGYAMYGVVYNGIVTANDVNLRPLEALIGGAAVGGVVSLLNVALVAAYFVLTGSAVTLVDSLNQLGMQGSMVALITAVSLLFGVFLGAALGGIGAAMSASLDEYSNAEPSMPQFG